MRTKTLFLAAAAIAAGLASSVAQSNIYSANIVGYINLPLTAGVNTLIANQLDNGTNDLASILAGVPNKTAVQLWNGSSFTKISKTAGAWTPDTIIPPGTGFFIQTPATAGAVTNQFLGQRPTTVTLPLTSLVNTLVGAPLPFSGNLNDAGANSLNIVSLPNKSSVQFWNGSGFTKVTKTAGAFNPNTAITVGQGYFINSYGASTWTETIQ